jgi:chromate transport protein ChrA
VLARAAPLTVVAAMIRIADIASVFVRYANFTLGGGSATTAVIHGEIVSKRHWVSEEQFALSFALGRLTPGTNVLAFCVGIGWILRRWSGAIVTLLASSIPCTLIVIAVTVLFSKWQENPMHKRLSKVLLPLPSPSQLKQFGQSRIRTSRRATVFASC